MLLCSHAQWSRWMACFVGLSWTGVWFVWRRALGHTHQRYCLLSLQSCSFYSAERQEISDRKHGVRVVGKCSSFLPGRKCFCVTSLVGSVTMRLSNFSNVICFLCQTDSHMRMLSWLNFLSLWFTFHLKKLKCFSSHFPF